jgi:IMP cyclohydrolase
MKLIPIRASSAGHLLKRINEKLLSKESLRFFTSTESCVINNLVCIADRTSKVFLLTRGRSESMIQELEFLSAMEYPGRLIIIGSDPAGENAVVVYAITGRSSSSQARKIIVENNHLLVIPTDETAVKEGNPDLLIYPAISISGGIVVSNGKQTGDILAGFHSQRKPLEILRSALSGWEYEPDAPAFTPRISGCLNASGDAALGIIRRAEDGSSRRDYFEWFLRPGLGKIVTTYAGTDMDPLPSFSGAPVECAMKRETAGEMAESVYTALGAKEITKDFRVAVACVFVRDLEKNRYTLAIINRHERTVSE